MKDIKVSIVVAVYNAEKYLEKAIRSILNQTFSDIEIIAVDDGSKDSSLKILNDLAKCDERLKILENHEESDGAALARNIGIRHATGRYLMILDSDDFFENDMIEKAYKLAEKSDADIVIFDGYRFDDKNQVDLERNSILYRDKLPIDRCVFEPEENKNNLFTMTIGAAWNVLFSMKIIKEYDLEFKSFHHADDFEFVYLAFAHAKKIAVLPERLIHYRVNHADSQAANVNKWPDTAWQSMLSFKNALEKDDLFDEYRVAFLRVAARYINFYINSMNDEDSFIKLFNNLQEKYLNELGFTGISKEELEDDDLFNAINLIINSSPSGFLFRKLKKQKPFDKVVSWKKYIPENSKIALWGADRMGTDVFHNILWERDYKMSIWVDNQFEEIGYPVKSPKKLLNSDFDYVLVCANSKLQWMSIFNILTDMGIKKEKIIWIGEKE